MSNGSPTPETASEVGRMIVFALARAEGLNAIEAMQVVEMIVRPRAPVPKLEEVLVAITGVILKR